MTNDIITKLQLQKLDSKNEFQTFKTITPEDLWTTHADNDMSKNRLAKEKTLIVLSQMFSMDWDYLSGNPSAIRKLSAKEAKRHLVELLTFASDVYQLSHGATARCCNSSAKLCQIHNHMVNSHQI
jgi:hypothetical protein